MRVTRVVAGLTAVIAAVSGLTLATAGPAAAASGIWRAYGNTNPITSSTSTWHCTQSQAVDTAVSAQGCAVRAANGISVQGAVIVRNNQSSLYGLSAGVDLWIGDDVVLGVWDCPYSGVAANSWSVCFGQTINESSPVTSTSAAGSVYLGTSPAV